MWNSQRVDGGLGNGIWRVKTKLKNLTSVRVLKKPTDLFLWWKNTLELIVNKLELLNPLSVLKKGYSVVKHENKIIKSIKEVKINDELKIKLLDGELKTNVKEVK